MSTHDWIPAQVPGNIHLDLLAADRIPDPFWGLQENEVQWVGESDWLYRCTFDLPEGLADGVTSVLAFDGLDTFATAWLNGTQLFTSDNMFLPRRLEVGTMLRREHNELYLLFESAWVQGKLREDKLGQRGLWNGDSSRLYVRKAQYHYGWDWGPQLLTAGPWRPVRLEIYEARLADLHAPVEVADDLKSATITVRAVIENAQALSDGALHLELYGPGDELVGTVNAAVSGEVVEHTFMVEQPQLWWPRGYGEQTLYRLVATLQRGGQALDRQEQRLGMRRLRLVREPFADEVGSSFFFEVNNTPIFCGGVNWIPADSFIPRIEPERYRRWLQMAADANMVMVRVWGGGIYEEDIFYEMCDELGLLVWQDFMFACGIYPAPSWFQESVRQEAEANVRRLRHHPSIVLWCGNNEDYAIGQSVYDPTFEGDFTTTAFPARAIYERLLPEICARLDPTRPYWPGSPYGGKDSGSLTEGDTHIWAIWHGAVPYQDYYKFAGRFVSEFGMQAFPVLSTLTTVVPEEELYPQSRTMDHHNKAGGGPRLLMGYVNDNVRLVSDMEGYSYLTQCIQCEAIAYALRGWRRRWKGPGREYTAGALVWQLNDCWPVTSWALVDYYLRPKPAYYTIKRELAPFVVNFARISTEQAEVWAINGLTTALNAELELRTWSLDGRLLTEERRTIELLPNQATELGQVANRYEEKTVVAARLVQGNTVLARAALWPEPFKYLTLPEPEVGTERVGDDTVRVSVKRPAKGVWVLAEKDVLWSDNMLDVFPDDPQAIVAAGLGDTGIAVRWLGK